MSHQIEGRLVNELHLSECILQSRVGKFGNYFLLVNHKHPEKTLRLYKPAAMELINMLPEAFNVAQTMEIRSYPEGSSHTVTTLNKRNNAVVNLYVSMYQGKAYVFVRLYMEQPDKTLRPSAYGVQFTPTDNVQVITNFVNQNK